MPFLLGGMHNRFELLKISKTPALTNKCSPSLYFKNAQIRVATSGNASRAAFLCTKEVLGTESILFGSDYPYETADGNNTGTSLIQYFQLLTRRE